ncbi:hypothetical protein ABEU20_002111 [Rhodococcus sp. PAM 2766]|uniref:Uncharacterized protein n=1 Tax=Rhodococcus parequi TaxID=3137122 RepID=A0ABW9FDB7_9NOCA
MDFGSLTAAISIPFGSADIVLAGIIDSVDYVLSGITAVAGDLFGSLGS